MSRDDLVVVRPIGVMQYCINPEDWDELTDALFDIAKSLYYLAEEHGNKWGVDVREKGKVQTLDPNVFGDCTKPNGTKHVINKMVRVMLEIFENCKLGGTQYIVELRLYQEDFVAGLDMYSELIKRHAKDLEEGKEELDYDMEELEEIKETIDNFRDIG